MHLSYLFIYLFIDHRYEPECDSYTLLKAIIGYCLGCSLQIVSNNKLTSK